MNGECINQIGLDAHYNADHPKSYYCCSNFSKDPMDVLVSRPAVDEESKGEAERAWKDDPKWESIFGFDFFACSYFVFQSPVAEDSAVKRPTSVPIPLPKEESPAVEVEEWYTSSKTKVKVVKRM